MEYLAAACFKLRLIRANIVAEHNIMNDVLLWVSIKPYIRRNLFGAADYEF